MGALWKFGMHCKWCEMEWLAAAGVNCILEVKHSKPKDFMNGRRKKKVKVKCQRYTNDCVT